MTVEKDRSPLPQKCLFAKEVKPGVYETVFDEEKAGATGCLILFLSALALVSGCTSKLFKILQKRSEKEKSVVEQVDSYKPILLQNSLEK